MQIDTIIKLERQKAARRGNIGDPIIAKADICAAAKNNNDPNQAV